jgi:PHD/YefM family antitoxin component YafN of YafNO toxin-antitoxin module
MMSNWLTGEAKQQFSEVLRRSETEPQKIFRRNHLVAAVISAQVFEEFEQWRDSRRRRTLGDAFGEVRELCARYDYELDTGDRRDRDAWEDDPS